MSDELILPIPLVPKEILNAVNTKTLAVFVGAGVSRIMGCKGWDQLAGELVRRCASIKRKDGSPDLNYRAIEILSHYTDHKKAITICHEIMKENGRRNMQRLPEFMPNCLSSVTRLITTANYFPPYLKTVPF